MQQLKEHLTVHDSVIAAKRGLYVKTNLQLQPMFLKTRKPYCLIIHVIPTCADQHGVGGKYFCINATNPARDVGGLSYEPT